MRSSGNKLMQKCQELVLEYLRTNPSGATNQEIADQTGLLLDVPNHRGYISWTILEHLVSTGKLEKKSEGKKKGIYRLVDKAAKAL